MKLFVEGLEGYGRRRRGRKGEGGLRSGFVGGVHLKARVEVNFQKPERQEVVWEEISIVFTLL